jgi:hypothetical protein
MAGIVSRKPVTGVAAGLIIGALGLLLIGIESPQTGRGVAALLFKVAGWFFLFVSAMAFLGAAIAWRRRSIASGAGSEGRGPGE